MVFNMGLPLIKQGRGPEWTSPAVFRASQDHDGEDESSLVSVNLKLSSNQITDRAVYKIENVPSFCPYPMDSKLPNTSVYNVLAMHAMYAPLIEMHAASDAVYTTLDNVDAFPDDRIVAAKDEMIAIALDRKGAVIRVSKKQGDEEKRKRSCTNHRRQQLGRAVCVRISHMLQLTIYAMPLS